MSKSDQKKLFAIFLFFYFIVRNRWFFFMRANFIDELINFTLKVRPVVPKKRDKTCPAQYIIVLIQKAERLAKICAPRNADYNIKWINCTFIIMMTSARFGDILSFGKTWCCLLLSANRRGKWSRYRQIKLLYSFLVPFGEMGSLW